MASRANALPRDWYRIRCEADADVAEVWIYDAIGESWFGGVSAKQFLEQIQGLPASAKTLRVHVNSPGGDVFDAVAIANLLRAESRDKGRTVEVHIEGLAASAASIVTSAGDAIKIASNAMMMVHNPQGMVLGEAADMRSMADALDSVRDSIVATYRWVSPLSAEELRSLMDAVTWMSAQEALEKGFVTEIVEPVKVEACFRPEILARLGTIPDAYRERVAALVAAAPVQAAEEDWRVGGARDLPLDEKASWDGAAADGRVRKWASTDGSGEKDAMDWPKYRKAFVAYNAADAATFTGYKLGFADVVDGRLMAIRAGLVAVRAVLEGGRGGVDLPGDVKARARAFVDGYLGKPEGDSAAAEAVPAPSALEPQAILAACKEAGCLELAEELLAGRATAPQMAARIAEAREIRGLCAAAKLPELAESYLAAHVGAAHVKGQLTIITAKRDAVEIITALPPDGDRPARPTPRLNPSAIYAERNARAGQRGA